MKEFSRSNIFEAGAASIAELFADYLENATDGGSCIALSLGVEPIGESSRFAIDKSLAALGYGERACTYAALYPRGAASASPDGEGRLDAQALFTLVEGLDPLCVIAADEGAAQALGETYRTSYDVDSPIRVFGRPAVAFRNLSTLLETPEGKQTAWRLFKSLPKR